MYGAILSRNPHADVYNVIVKCCEGFEQYIFAHLLFCILFCGLMTIDAIAATSEWFGFMWYNSSALADFLGDVCVGLVYTYIFKRHQQQANTEHCVNNSIWLILFDICMWMRNWFFARRHAHRKMETSKSQLKNSMEWGTGNVVDQHIFVWESNS